jgi:hypothetical protein
MNTGRNVPFFAWTLAISLFAIDLHGAERAIQEPTITSHIPRESVQSSGLAAVGYSKRKQILEIQFNNGAVYRYLSVPPSVYRDLMSSESKTRYYDSNIRRNYRSMRVRPRVKDRVPN